MTGSPELRVLHVCSEPVNEGSAPQMHSIAIATGLGAYHDLHVATVWRRAGTTGRWAALLAHQLRVIRAIGSADVIYARWHVLDLPVHVAARIRRVPLVLEVNGRTDDLLIAHPRLHRLGPVVSALAAISFRRASHVIAVSPGLQQWVRDIIDPRRVSWVSNGAPVELSAQRTESVHPPRVVFIGQLASWQGIDVLLEAAQSPLWPPECELHIVGSGPGEAAVQQAAQNPRVHHHGRLPRSQAIAILAGARLSVSPQRVSVSRNSVMGLPFKVMESMMLGVPVVGSALAQQRELLDDAPGCRTFEGDDPDQLAAAVSGAINAGATVRSSLRTFARENCSWDRAIAEAHRAVLRVLG